MNSHNSQIGISRVLSRQTFIKIFLDLVDKGLIRSESQTDILSVNNTIALGMRLRDLEEVLRIKMSELDLPLAIKNWV